jgi:DNA-binding YbaB/EbfC family protein
MAKGGFSGFGGGNMNNLMRQAQKMQQEMAENMERVNAELAERVVEASAGGGVVAVAATCDMRIKEISIKPEAVDPDDVEMLQDLIVAAANEALRKADEAAKAEREKVAGGLGGLGGLL